jgi:hypothetical protein
MYLYGTTTPEVGKTYAIHPYSAEDSSFGYGASTAITVEGSDVRMRVWEGNSSS